MELRKIVTLLGSVAVLSVGIVLTIPSLTSALDNKTSAEQPIYEANLHLKKHATYQERDRIEIEYNLVDPRDNSVVMKLESMKHESEDYQTQVNQLVKELANKYDQPMIPIKLNDQGEIIPGQSRVILNESELEQLLLQERTLFGKNIELPLTENPPNITAESIQGIDNHIISSYKTSFNPNVKGRTTNIALSSAEINDIVLGPGDRFYFNTIVGNSTADKGYQLAPVIINQEYAEDYGGGVCQTSSTLYNAVDQAGLEILELHHHSKEVGYVPIGRDATIAYGGKDFKFMNNKDYPILIRTIVDQQNGTLEVQIRAGVQEVAIN
jgi:vancomycin resistance protein YoaR